MDYIFLKEKVETMYMEKNRILICKICKIDLYQFYKDNTIKYIKDIYINYLLNNEFKIY